VLLLPGRQQVFLEQETGHLPYLPSPGHISIFLNKIYKQIFNHLKLINSKQINQACYGFFQNES
jgi:hypothetical protein